MNGWEREEMEAEAELLRLQAEIEENLERMGGPIAEVIKMVHTWSGDSTSVTRDEIAREILARLQDWLD